MLESARYSLQKSLLEFSLSRVGPTEREFGQHWQLNIKSLDPWTDSASLYVFISLIYSYTHLLKLIPKYLMFLMLYYMAFF